MTTPYGVQTSVLLLGYMPSLSTQRQDGSYRSFSQVVSMTCQLRVYTPVANLPMKFRNRVKDAASMLHSGYRGKQSPKEEKTGLGLVPDFSARPARSVRKVWTLSPRPSDVCPVPALFALSSGLLCGNRAASAQREEGQRGIWGGEPMSPLPGRFIGASGKTPPLAEEAAGRTLPGWRRQSP